jgi:hypothetical protein
MNQIDKDTIELLEAEIKSVKFSYKAIGKVKNILLAMLGLIKRNLENASKSKQSAAERMP